MGLETVVNIADLVRTNPPGSDPKSQGDDHLRNIKTALLNNIVGYTGAVTVTGVDGGAVNAYTLTPAAGTLLAYGLRMVAIFSPTITNTGAVTLNISGLGAKNVLSVAGIALVANDLIAGRIYVAVYNGTEFRLAAVTQNFIEQLAFGSAFPAQPGNGGKFPTTDGGTPGVVSWTDTFTIPITFNSRLDESKGADIASAPTINLSTTTGNLIHVTGTTTITAITIPSGAEREIVFDGALTLTHNATTLILPTGADITTAAGDCATVRGDGSGNARVVKYSRASGHALIAPAMRLLATVTPTAAANVDFLNVFSSTYDDYLIILDGIRPSANDRLKLRYAVAGVVVTTSNYFGSGFGVSATALDHILLGAPTYTTAGIGVNGEVNIRNANHATQPKGGNVFIAGQINATPTFQGEGGWSAFNGGIVTGFRLFWEGGANFAAQGSVKVYGVTK